MLDFAAFVGESIINLIVNILIIALILILLICALILDVIINTFSFLFETDFVSKVYEALPVLSQADNVLTVMGVAIAVILLLVMIFHMGLAPLLSAGKNVAYPSLVIFRTLFVIPLVICAESISVYLSNLFTTFYSVMSSAFSAQIGGYTSSTTPFYLTTALAKFLVEDVVMTFTDFFTATEQSLGFFDGVMDIISSAVSMILIFVLVILVGWNLIQFFLELFERFATMFFIMKISPLCLATAIYPSTEMVAKSWLRFFIGQFSLWVLQVMCVGWVIGCLGSPDLFLETFADTNGRMTGILAWAGISYGLINMSRHVDDYINKLGLTAATTGSDFFRDIASLARAIHTGKQGAKAAIGFGKGVAKGAAYIRSALRKPDPGTSLATVTPPAPPAQTDTASTSSSSSGSPDNKTAAMTPAGRTESGLTRQTNLQTGANTGAINQEDYETIKALHPETDGRYDNTFGFARAQTDKAGFNNVLYKSAFRNSDGIITKVSSTYAIENTTGNGPRISDKQTFVPFELSCDERGAPVLRNENGHNRVDFSQLGQSMCSVDNGNSISVFACDKDGNHGDTPVNTIAKADIPNSSRMNDAEVLSAASLRSAMNTCNQQNKSGAQKKSTKIGIANKSKHEGDSQ